MACASTFFFLDFLKRGIKKPFIMGFINYMAGVAGIEPASVVLETIILPLYYTPMRLLDYIIIFIRKWQ